LKISNVPNLAMKKQDKTRRNTRL